MVNRFAHSNSVLHGVHLVKTKMEDHFPGATFRPVRSSVFPTWIEMPSPKHFESGSKVC